MTTEEFSAWVETWIKANGVEPKDTFMRDAVVWNSPRSFASLQEAHDTFNTASHAEFHTMVNLCCMLYNMHIHGNATMAFVTSFADQLVKMRPNIPYNVAIDKANEAVAQIINSGVDLERANPVLIDGDTDEGLASFEMMRERDQSTVH